MAALLMVFTFVMFLITDIVVRKVQAKRVLAAARVPGNVRTAVPFGLSVEDLLLPAGLFFHQGHTWAGIDVSGKIKVGLDDFSQKILGRIDNVTLRKVGDTVYRGEKIFTIKQGKKQAEFNSPVDGIISSINEQVVDNPKILKENPYEKGWLYSIKPTNLANDIRKLSVAGEAMTWLKHEVKRFKMFLDTQFVNDKKLGITMADGGIPVEGVMEYMDDFSWMKLQEEFLEK